MNYLFFTNNHDRVEALTKQYAKDNNLEFVSIEANKDGFNQLYTIDHEMCIFIKNLNNSPTCDVLLKLLEENRNNLHVFATARDNISEALKARFTIKTMQDISYASEIESFMQGKSVSKEVYSDVYFYKQLAFYLVKHYNAKTIDNLILLHTIIDDYNLSSTNFNWSYQYRRLCNGFIK